MQLALAEGSQTKGDRRNAASGTPSPKDCQTECFCRCSPLDELSASRTLRALLDPTAALFDKEVPGHLGKQ
ncbi:hypothetical protein LDENG_00120830 [Lucifuga dentata]|nr:hypothetical protein LDENG_00120830 [Lucifuga dentata]